MKKFIHQQMAISKIHMGIYGKHVDVVHVCYTLEHIISEVLSVHLREQNTNRFISWSLS